MDNLERYLNRNFSAENISANIKISLSGGCDGEELFDDLKMCLQKWSRQARCHGGSGVGYCIEREKTNVS